MNLQTATMSAALATPDWKFKCSQMPRQKMEGTKGHPMSRKAIEAGREKAALPRREVPAS